MAIKKSMFFILFFVLVLSSFTYASIRTELLHYYNTTGTFDDSVGNIDGSITGTQNFTGTNILDNWFYFDGTNDRVDLDGSLDSFFDLDHVTINLWVWHDSTDTEANDIFSMGDSAVQEKICPLISGDASANKDTPFCRVSGASVQINQDTSGDLWTSTRKMFTMVFYSDGGNTDWCIYIDGVNDTCNTFTDQTYGFDYTTIGALCRQGGCVNYAEGNVSHIGFWNRSLTSTEILSLYDLYIQNLTPITNGTGGGVPPSPSLTIYTNLTNGTINYNEQNINFNYSGVFSNNDVDIVNISFFQQGKHNITLLDVNLSVQNYFNITLPFEYEGLYNISLNASNFEVSDSTIVYIYKVDLKSEMINTTCTNGTIYTQGGTLSCFVDYNDTFLFATNTSTKDSNGNLWNSENQFFENLTITSMRVNISYSLTDLGNFTLVFDSWDSHTDIGIKDYKIDYLNNGLEFEDSIKIYSNNLTFTKTTKYIDRYDFEFIYSKDSKAWKSIYVETNGKLYYVQDSKYKYHLVDFKNKKWIDFEGFEMPQSSIIKHTDNLYEIKFRTEETNIKFNSIGDLNHDTLTLNYEVIVPSSAVNLTGIENSINNLSTNLREGVSMFGIIILIILFVIVGWISRMFFLWLISSGLCLTFVFYYSSLDYSIWNVLLLWTYILLTALFLILGITLQIMEFINNKKKGNKIEEDFYINY